MQRSTTGVFISLRKISHFGGNSAHLRDLNEGNSHAVRARPRGVALMRSARGFYHGHHAFGFDRRRENRSHVSTLLGVAAGVMRVNCGPPSKDARASVIRAARDQLPRAYESPDSFINSTHMIYKQRGLRSLHEKGSIAKRQQQVFGPIAASHAIGCPVTCDLNSTTLSVRNLEFGDQGH